jgi:hypothetical protein
VMSFLDHSVLEFYNCVKVVWEVKTKES